MSPGLVPGLLERVDKQHDIARVLRVAFVHLERTAPGGRAPVDLPHPVAHLERADVGELDPVSTGARDMCAEERLRAERRYQLSQLLLMRKRAQVHTSAEAPLPSRNPQRITGANRHRTDAVRPPPPRPHQKRDLGLRPRAHAHRHGAVGSDSQLPGAYRRHLDLYRLWPVVPHPDRGR